MSGLQTTTYGPCLVIYEHITLHMISNGPYMIIYCLCVSIRVCTYIQICGGCANTNRLADDRLTMRSFVAASLYWYFGRSVLAFLSCLSL